MRFKIIIIGLYVDDMLILTKIESLIIKIKTDIKKAFKVKNFDLIDKILVI